MGADEFSFLQELRQQKNFSSLKAIISGLQSHSVYRLKRSWASLPKYAVTYLTLSICQFISQFICKVKIATMKM